MNFIKENKGIVIIVAIVAIIGFVVISTTTNSNKKTGSVAQNTQNPVAQKVVPGIDTDKDGIPDNAEVVLGTDPQNPDTDGDGANDKVDKNPTLVDGVFKKSTGAKGFIIKSILVENNVDETTKKGAPDHLEILLKNIANKPISNFTVFYKIVDQTNGATQSYELPLTGFVLPAGKEAPVHIDISGKQGHFRANPNNSYYQSINPKDVTVVVSADGYKAQEMSVKKDKGGAETAD